MGCTFLLTVRCPLSHFPSWKWSGLCVGEGRAPSGVVSRHRPWKEGAAQHAALGYRHAERQVSVDVSIHATKVGVVPGIWANMEHVTHRNSRNLRLALGRVTGGFSEPMRMPCACRGGVVRLVGLWLVGPLLPWSLWPSGGPCRDKGLSTCPFILGACLGAWRVEARHWLGLAGSGLGNTSIWCLSLCHPYPQVSLVTI